MAATQTIGSSNKQAFVPEQQLSRVRDARETAKSLLEGTHPLATSKEVIMSVDEIAKAKEGGYALAMDPKGLPKTAGWHQIIRNDNEVTYSAIDETAARELMAAERYNEVLFVQESALNAEKEGNPSALDISKFEKWERLRAVYSADMSCKVALSTQTDTSNQAAAQKTTKLLRVLTAEQVIVIRSPTDSADIIIRAPVGTTVRLRREKLVK